MNVERTDFVSVFTQDIRRAKEFYGETLGLEIESEGESDMEFRCGQVTLELEAKGFEFDGETLETAVCRMAFFKDPDGNALLLHRRYDA